MEIYSCKLNNSLALILIMLASLIGHSHSVKKNLNPVSGKKISLI